MQKHHFTTNHSHCFCTNYSCGLCPPSPHTDHDCFALWFVATKDTLQDLFIYTSKDEQACPCRLNNLILKIDRVKVVKFSDNRCPVLPFPWDVWRCWLLTIYTNHVGPVVWKMDGTIHWINLYPVDGAIGFPNFYPLDSDLSSRIALSSIWTTRTWVENLYINIKLKLLVWWECGKLQRLKRVGILPRLRLQPLFSEASLMVWCKTFDFPIGISGFPM